VSFLKSETVAKKIADFVWDHVTGINALRKIRAWLRQNGYVDGGSYQLVSIGVFVIHYVHPKRPGLELVYLTSQADQFLQVGKCSGVYVIEWPPGA